MSFADKLRTLAAAHDEEQRIREQEKAEAADAVTREHFAEVLSTLEGRLEEAARSGKTELIVARLFDIPVPDRHRNTDMQGVYRRNDWVVLNVRLVDPKISRFDGDHRRATIEASAGGGAEVPEIRTYIHHPSILAVWDALVGMGLSPYFDRDHWNRGGLQIAVRIPR